MTYRFPGLIIALLLQCLFTASAEASLIAEWNFDDGDLIPDGGSQSSTASLTTSGGAVSFPANGTGRALQMAGTGGSQFFTLALSGTGLSDFEVKYEGVSGPLIFIIFAFNSSIAQTWSWSTDNVTFSSAGVTAQPGPLTTSGGFDDYLVDFSGVSSIEDAPLIYLRNDLTAGFLGTPDLTFDNLTVNAVPEPSGVVTLLFGLAALVFLARRRLKLRRPLSATQGGSE